MTTENPMDSSTTVETPTSPPTNATKTTVAVLIFLILLVIAVGLAFAWWWRKRKRRYRQRQGRQPPPYLPDVNYRADDSEAGNGEAAVDIAMEPTENTLLQSHDQSARFSMIADNNRIREETDPDMLLGPGPSQQQDIVIGLPLDQMDGEALGGMGLMMMAPDEDLGLESSDGEAMYITPPPIPVAMFVDHVTAMKEDSNSFEDEWSNLSDCKQRSQNCARIEANLRKNRYKNILPYDHSRVVLELIESIPHSDYINASHIQGFSQEGSYIASQGPNLASVPDFWRMVWQEKVDTIVMVTNLTEKGKTKCEQYWPSTEDQISFDDINVFCDGEHHALSDVRRAFTIERPFPWKHIQYWKSIDAAMVVAMRASDNL